MSTYSTLVEYLLIFLLIVAISVVSAWLSRFVLRITNGSDKQTIPYKVRRFARFPPFAVFILLSILVALVELDASQWIAFVWLFVFLSVVLVQLVSLTLALFSERSRAIAIASTEGKVARMALIASIMFAKFAAKILIGFARLVAETQQSSRGHGNRRGPGYYGYLSYEEDAKRKSGDWF
tara:strand:- start:22091 stop:22630 length:540 start_codon:yes stop_codon:yes gene_type:complete